MARAVGGQQANKALVDRRIQIVGEEIFPILQFHLGQQLPNRKLAVPDNMDKVTNGSLAGVNLSGKGQT